MNDFIYMVQRAIYDFEAVTFRADKEIGVLLNSQRVKDLEAEMSMQLTNFYYGNNLEGVRIFGKRVYSNQYIPYDKILVGFIEQLTTEL